MQATDGLERAISCTDAVRLRYRLWAEGGRQSILFIHGLAADQRQFAADAAFFAGRGFSCATVDLRGHGTSSAPVPPTRATLSVETMASDLVRLLDAMDAQSIHLVGNSLGGLVALALSERVHPRIATLTTFGTAYRLRRSRILPVVLYAVSTLMGPRRLAEATAQSATTDSARPILRAMLVASNPRLNYFIQQNLCQYDFLATARDLGRPLLILRGEHDKAINKYLPTTLAALEHNRDFQLVALPGAGHFANLEQPEAFRNALLAFLGGARTGGA